jgi:hypothetical protein
MIINVNTQGESTAKYENIIVYGTLVKWGKGYTLELGAARTNTHRGAMGKKQKETANILKANLKARIHNQMVADGYTCTNDNYYIKL